MYQLQVWHPPARAFSQKDIPLTNFGALLRAPILVRVLIHSHVKGVAVYLTFTASHDTVGVPIHKSARGVSVCMTVTASPDTVGVLIHKSVRGVAVYILGNW